MSRRGRYGKYGEVKRLKRLKVYKGEVSGKIGKKIKKGRGTDSMVPRPVRKTPKS